MGQGLEFLASTGVALGTYIASVAIVYQIINNEIPQKIVNYHYTTITDYPYTTIAVSGGVAAGCLYYLSSR